MRIRIISEGKTKDAHLRALQADYASRIAHFTDFVLEELRPERKAGNGRGGRLSATDQRLLEKIHGSTKVLLDERGREGTSEDFGEWLGQQALRGDRGGAFLLGGPERVLGRLREQGGPLV